MRNLASIDIGQCPAAHALSDIELVFRMTVMSFPNINGDDEPGSRCFDRHAPLCLTQKAPRVIGWLRLYIVKIRKLNDRKREVPLAPVLSPGFDHRRQQDLVLLSAILVGFTLIPECTHNGEWDKWSDHAIVDRGGDSIFAERIRNSGL